MNNFEERKIDSLALTGNDRPDSEMSHRAD